MKKIYMQKPDGQTTALGEADSSFPDEIIVRDAKAKFGQDAKIGIEETEDTLPGTNGLSLRMKPPSTSSSISPDPVQTGQFMTEIVPSAIQSLARSADPALGALSYGAPAVMAAAFPQATALRVGGQAAASYIIPGLAQLAARHAGGEKPVTAQDFQNLISEGVGMGVSGGLSQGAPLLNAMPTTASRLARISAAITGEAGANIVGQGVERAGKGQSPIPSLTDVGIQTSLALPFSYSPYRMHSANRQSEMLNTLAESLKQNFGFSDDTARMLAPLVSDSPEIQGRVADLMKVEGAAGIFDQLALHQDEIGMRAMLGLGDRGAGAKLVGTPEERATVAREAGQVLSEAQPKAAKELRSTVESEAAQRMGRQTLDSPQQAVEDAQNRLREIARVQMNQADQILATTQAAEIQQLSEDIFKQSMPTTAWLKATEQTDANLGTIARSLLNKRTLANRAIRKTEYDKLAKVASQSPAAQRGVEIKPNDPATDPLEKLTEGLAEIGVMDVKKQVRNIFDQFYPQDGVVPTAQQIIERMPSFNEARTAVKSIKDGTARRSMLRAIQMEEAKVYAGLDPIFQADPQLKMQWDKAKKAQANYAIADNLRFEWDPERMEAASIGKQMSRVDVEAGLNTDVRSLYSVLRGPASNLLKQQARKSAFASALNAATDPTTGQVNFQSLEKALFNNRLTVGDDVVEYVGNIIRNPSLPRDEAQRMVDSMKALAGDKLFSSVANFDPSAVSLASRIDPVATDEAKAAGLRRLIRAHFTDAGFDADGFAKDPIIRKLRGENPGDPNLLSHFPEVALLLEGAGAQAALTNERMVKRLLGNMNVSDAKGIYQSFLRNAQIGPDEVSKFKEIILADKAKGQTLWNEIRNTFWQDQMINPDTGMFDPSRWMQNVNGPAGYSRSFLAEMAGAGAGLPEAEAMKRVNTWGKLIKKLQPYSEMFSEAPSPGMTKAQFDQQKREHLIGATAALSGMGLGGQATLRYAYQLGLRQMFSDMSSAFKQTRLFDRRTDWVTDKLTQTLRQLESLMQRGIESQVNPEFSAGGKQL